MHNLMTNESVSWPSLSSGTRHYVTVWVCFLKNRTAVRVMFFKIQCGIFIICIDLEQIAT